MPDLSITSRGHLPGVGQTSDAERLKQTAHQFEQVFVEMILKRNDSEKNGLLDEDPASQQFQGLLNTGLSEQAAGHLGISDILIRELGARTHLTNTPSSPPLSTTTPPTSSINGVSHGS